MRISYDSAQLCVPRGAPLESEDALPIVVMSFGRLTFRRSLPRPAMHGWKRCATRTGETWPDRPRSDRNKRKDANTSHFDCSCCPRGGATPMALRIWNFACYSATAALVRETVASPVQLYPRWERSVASRKPDASQGLTSSSRK